MNAVLATTLAMCFVLGPASAGDRSFNEQVAGQRAIEQVYWAHRTWPADNATAKPSLDSVLSDAALRAKLTRSLARTATVEERIGRTITRKELRTEVQRMIRDSHRPDILDELFAALGRDQLLIEDLLARPILTEKLVSGVSAPESANAVTCESWIPTTGVGAPVARADHSAIWTGAEMIVWGGLAATGIPNTQTLTNRGARYDPATDGWTAVSTIGAPDARHMHTAVWSGSTMIVWGGYDLSAHASRTGGRYDVITDSWTPSTVVDAPSARFSHVAVWDGSEMLIWGGCDNGTIILDGFVHRYRPDIDHWSTSAIPGPTGQCGVAGVWSGSELLLYGSLQAVTAHRYAPATDTWSVMSSVNSPNTRPNPTAVWTGTEMIIYGGGLCCEATGGRYTPSTDTWALTTLTGAPPGRSSHTAVWSGSEMIVWGGKLGSGDSLGDGARYDPVTDVWTALPPAGAPSPRNKHSAVWTGDEMIVWGGRLGDIYLPFEFYADGARYSTQGAAEACNGRDDDCNGIVDDGVSCDDGNPCNGVETCGGASGCLAGTPLPCDDGNPCTDDACDPASGCVHSNNTDSCTDGNACTVGDVCGGGSCHAGVPIVCTAQDQCHDAGTCSPDTGLCSNPAKPNGTACDDGDPTTSGDACQSGVCAGSSCPPTPDPKTKGYYRKLCNNDHSGDALTQADVQCVASLTVSFSGFTSVNDVCSELQNNGGDQCSREEDQLLVLALNLCKRRLCTTEEIDSNCGSHSKSVGQSLAEMDAIFSNPDRDRFSCNHGGCLGEEINNGRALKLISLE